MTADLIRPSTDALELRAEGDGRTLTIRLLRWGEVAQTPEGRESFVPGALEGVDPASVIVESQRHDGAIVGRGTALYQRADGPYLDVRISETTEGRDLLTLVRDGVLTAASVVFRPIAHRDAAGVIERTRVELRRVAILARGAYPSAQVVAVRSNDMPTETPMPPEPTPPEPTPEPEPLPYRALMARMDSFDQSLAQVAAATAYGRPARQETLLARYASFGDAFLAAADDPTVAEELGRALADNVLHPDNAALDRPSWLAPVISPINWGRPVVNAFGITPAPDSGMTMQWPIFDPTSDFQVSKTTGEKVEIASGKVKYKSANATLDVYAGGADNSLQLLERSAPSFRELLLAEYARRYAMATESAMVEAVTTTAATGPMAGTVDISGTKDVPNLLAALFAASVKVEAETGQPASFVLAAPDVFQALGAIEGLWPGAYGTQNVGGTAQASTLSINISGLTIRQARQLTAGKLIVSNGQTARWAEDGPRTIEALNVAKLGRDIAIYGYGVPVLFRPAGIVVLTATLPTP